MCVCMSVCMGIKKDMLDSFQINTFKENTQKKLNKNKIKYVFVAGVFAPTGT